MSTELALMDTDRWHCWGYTDHQGTLIISALMICNERTALCPSYYYMAGRRRLKTFIAQ
ncbi:unnamed protein product [Staurois parvus]|uniref:Transposase n=1 Tax=Staurois parvus TaxID=386267 RepID=A0ABN9D7R4_9NEOB|nr:unnamed protein product [Staurois parvus]